MAQNKVGKEINTGEALELLAQIVERNPDERETVEAIIDTVTGEVQPGPWVEGVLTKIMGLRMQRGRLAQRMNEMQEDQLWAVVHDVAREHGYTPHEALIFLLLISGRLPGHVEQAMKGHVQEFIAETNRLYGNMSGEDEDHE